VAKPNKTPGRCDLVLPVDDYLIVTKWKAIPIDFLDIPVPTEISQKVTRATGASDEQILREKKASVLSEYSCSKVLDIKFGKNDKFHASKLRKWIIDKVAPQLKSYIMNEEVKKLQRDLSLKAHIVVVIGSRQILVWDMHGDGKLVKAPISVGQKA
jgi:hypothetical protein